MRQVICLALFALATAQNTNGNGQQQGMSQQNDATGGGSNMPGYLPDYQGDKYTDPQRIKDTQELNKKFFDSIGGAPSPPPKTPAQEGMNGSPSSTTRSPLMQQPAQNYGSNAGTNRMYDAGYNQNQGYSQNQGSSSYSTGPATGNNQQYQPQPMAYGMPSNQFGPTYQYQGQAGQAQSQQYPMGGAYPQQGYGAPQQGYGAPQQGYGAPQQMYQNQNQYQQQPNQYQMQGGNQYGQQPQYNNQGYNGNNQYQMDNGCVCPQNDYGMQTTTVNPRFQNQNAYTSTSMSPTCQQYCAQQQQQNQQQQPYQSAMSG